LPPGLPAFVRCYAERQGAGRNERRRRKFRMRQYRFIRTEVSEQILTVVIDRPEVLNALHRAAHGELEQAFDAFAADPTQRVAIITGSGERSFCTGSDLKAKSQRASSTAANPRMTG